jgi:O-antigen/teichoic acid export membrane protein
MKNRIRAYRNSEFLKNSLITVSGTVAAQFIVLLAQPVLRRIYPAEDFGLMSVFLSLVGIPVVVAGLRYELAVMLPRSQKEADNLTAATFFIHVVFSLAVGAGVWTFADQLLLQLNVGEDFRAWLPAVGPAIFFYANFTLMNQWLVRRKHFGAVNWLKLTRRSTEAASQILLQGFSRFPGLLWGELVGRLLFNFLGIFFLIRKGFSFRFLRVKSAVRLLKEYSRFPKYSFLPTLLNSAGLLLPPILFNRLFGTEQTGYFDLTLQVLAVPVMFVVNSLGTVINQQLAEAYRNREPVKSKVYRIMKNLLVPAVSFVLFFWFFSPYLFGVIFGEAYVVSGHFAKVLAVAFGFRILVFPFTVVFAALDQIREGSIVQFIHFFGICSILFLKTNDSMHWLIAYAALEFMVSGIYLFLILRGIGRYEHSIKMRKLHR